MGSMIGLFRVIGVLPDGYSGIGYGMFSLHPRPETVTEFSFTVVPKGERSS